MQMKSTRTFKTAEEASDYINSLPVGAKISLGLHQSRTISAEYGEQVEIQWKVTTTIYIDSLADFNMEILHNIETSTQEEKDAIDYAISCIKTLQDMEIIK